MAHATQRRPVAKLGALCAIFALTAPVSAADLPGTPRQKAPPPALAVAAPSSWTGLYAGTVVGAGYASVRSSQTTSRTASTWGQTSGALLGYAFQSGPLVYGPEAGFDFHLLRPENNGSPSTLDASVNDTLETFRLRARIGYELGAFLPYLAAGVAASKAYEMNYPWPQDAYGQSRWETGASLGAGVEWRFVAPFFGPLVARAEYIYDAYPTETFALENGALMHARASEQFLRVGLIDYFDPNWRPPASADVHVDWSGSYAGLLGGGMWARPHTSLAGAPSTDFDASGWAAGVFTGHNFVFGSWVVGYEGALLAANVTGSGPQPTLASTTFRNYFETDLRLRVGYGVGRFLPYLTAGGDWGRSEQSDPAVANSYRGRIPSDGVAAGGGVEYALGDRWTARAEYLVDAPIGSSDTRLDALRLDQTRFAQTARVGLAYYFH